LKKAPQKLSGYIQAFPSFLGKSLDVKGGIIWIKFVGLGF